MAYSTDMKKEKAFLFLVLFDNREDIEYMKEELIGLVKTAGLEVSGFDYQYVREVTPATLIGKGKLEELKEKLESNPCDVVIFDAELLGSQERNISEYLGIKVIDRIALILDIFAGRAKSSEGKLQVSLALNKYLLPRLSSISGTSGRFGSGGVGMRGPGETKLELDKRVVKHDIQKLEQEIKKIKERRNLNRAQRNKSGKKKIAIVGYTNAGKSTLLNALTKENIYADNKLFATLDTTSRSLYLKDNQSVIITDTVGFISRLPHNLVDAFSATLEEASDSDIILHVVDVSNTNYKEQIKVVEEVLKSISCDKIPTILVLNKIDEKKEAILLEDNQIAISAKKGINLDDLKSMIYNMIKAT